MDGSIGRRVIVVGPSCAGKSTLGAALAAWLGAPFIELDALYWKPGWQPTPDAEFHEMLRDAHAGESWVTAGNYFGHTVAVTWPLADTIIWLDFPRQLTTWRILRRSWRRWRSREVLWGTNTERFWSQLKVWDPDESLIAYTLRSHERRRMVMLAAMDDPQWSRVSFVRLPTPGSVRRFVAALPDVGTGG